MRKIFKRGIAIIMSLALISGIGIVANNKVKAEGEIETPPAQTVFIPAETVEPSFSFYGRKEVKDVSEGDSITLIYDGEYIGDEYTYEWHKRKYTDDDDIASEDINLEETGLSYTIESVGASDFYEEDNDNGIRYQIDVFKNGKWIGLVTYFIYAKDVQSTTKENPTTTKVSEQPTSSEQPTTPATEKVTAPTKAKITKVNTKKKSAKKVKLSLKKINKAKGYQVAVYTSKKTAKNDKNAKKALVKKYVKKVSVTISSKKLKNKKKLYIKARAYVLDGKTKVYGNWSTVKQVKIKK